MSKDEEIIKKMETVDIDDLETVTIQEIRELKPRIFGENSFKFIINDLGKAKVLKKVKTRVGFGDMYILDTVPVIYTFGNAYDQLEEFVQSNRLKPKATIKFVKKFIPEGKDSYDTQYIFEKV